MSENGLRAVKYKQDLTGVYHLTLRASYDTFDWSCKTWGLISALGGLGSAFLAYT